jgi:hypothetical protein
MNRGLSQSSKIIIEDCNVTNAYILRSILGKQKIGIEIDELWILFQKEVKLFYKTEKQR